MKTPVWIPACHQVFLLLNKPVFTSVILLLCNKLFKINKYLTTDYCSVSIFFLLEVEFWPKNLHTHTNTHTFVQSILPSSLLQGIPITK